MLDLFDTRRAAELLGCSLPEVDGLEVTEYLEPSDYAQDLDEVTA